MLAKRAVLSALHLAARIEQRALPHSHLQAHLARRAERDRLAAHRERERRRLRAHRPVLETALRRLHVRVTRAAEGAARLDLRVLLHGGERLGTRGTDAGRRRACLRRRLPTHREVQRVARLLRRVD